MLRDGLRFVYVVAHPTAITAELLFLRKQFASFVRHGRHVSNGNLAGLGRSRRYAGQGAFPGLKAVARSRGTLQGVKRDLEEQGRSVGHTNPDRT